MGQKNIPFLQSAWVNNSTYQDYFDRLQILARSIFEWKNLPETCDSRFLEKSLFYYGKAIFIKDENLGFLNLNCVPSGKLNVYELPVQYEAYSTGYSKRFDADKCVLIMNNCLMRPTLWSIQLFALRLYETERTIDVNVKAQKTPVLLTCNNNQRLTLENLYLKYEGNQPFIFADKSQDLGSMVNCIKTDAPYLADKLQDYKHEIWNECLTYLGINNANTDKKERLIVDEVTANDDLINLNLDTFLKYRKEACDNINKMFNLNVSVEIRQDIQELLEKELQKLKENDTIEENEGGEENV